MQSKRGSLVMVFLWAIAHTVACADYIEIGTGTYTTTVIPVYGYYNYSWSQTIHLQSDIGSPVLISGIAFDVANSPVNYVMYNQRIYLKHTGLTAFPDATYEDAETAGFTKVFEGTVTFNGSGWHQITFDAPFAYNGTDNLIVYWQNWDGLYASGIPTFRYTSRSNRSKYKYQDYSFPTVTGFRSSYVPNVRLFYTNWQPLPADGAEAVYVGAAPTVSWSTPEDVVSNALYFSSSAALVAAADPSVCVLPPGGSVHSCFTNATDLAPATTYHWMVQQFYEASTICAGPYSFTTEPAPQTSYPWNVDFENGGLRPPFWLEEPLVGNAGWVFRSGGTSGMPATPWRGDYNAAFGGNGGGAKTRLISPILNLSATAAPWLTFMQAQPTAGGLTDALHIYYRNARDGEWLPVPGGDFFLPTEEWTRRAISLPDPTATYYLAFEGLDNGGGGVALDDLYVLDGVASLTVQVYDCYGDPLADTPVTVNAPDAAHGYASGQTDGGGLFALAGLPAGPVQLGVDDVFHQLYRQSRTLSSGEAATQRVDLVAAAHLSGVVRKGTGTGERIEGAAIGLYAPGTPPTLVASDTTDAFGQYKLPRIDPGAYQLQSIHPAYEPCTTGITVNASTTQDLALQPLPGDFFDVYVQVQGVLSGLPVTDSSVEITVRNNQGAVVYSGLVLTDADGKVCFRGVVPGSAVFACNKPEQAAHPWWESYTSAPQPIANAKLVQIRLEPKKGATTVELNFAPLDVWGNPKDPAPYIQNFWVEACGYDPVTANQLYPPRTALTDAQGVASFAELPTLPTKITVRRPGFVPQTTLITPDDNAAFPALVTMPRPPITPGTVWDLTVEQDLFNRMLEGAESGTPGIYVKGLPNSNTEGYEENPYRYPLIPFDSPPAAIDTDHGEMGVWGQGQYLLTPGEYGYMVPGDGMGGFYCGLQFPPQLVVIAEGETNTCTIHATFAPARAEGVLYAADEVSEDGVTLYHPVANMDVQFVLHEGVRGLYQPGTFVHTTSTDSNGCYSIQLPPGIYGIEIPSMPGYWGYKVDAENLVGWSGQDSGWPYAYTNDWDSDAVSTYIYAGGGVALGSDHQTKLDLYVHRDRYALKTAVSDTSPVQWRLLYRAPDGSASATRRIFDVLESETRLTLSDGSSAPIREILGGTRTFWTNLVGGTLSITGEDHPYLSSTSVVTCTTFDWGDYPGQPPASEPPFGSVLTQTPLPMIGFNTGSYRMESDGAPTNAPPITVVYATGNPEDPFAEYETYPSYVEFKDLPGNIYVCDQMDRGRVQTYYVAHTRAPSGLPVYAVPGAGPFTVNTVGGTPVVLPLPAYNLQVVAVNMDNPADVIPDFPFTYDGGSYTTPYLFTGVTTAEAVDWDYTTPNAWQKQTIGYRIDPTNSPLTTLATLYVRPRVNVSGTVKNAVSGLPVSGATVELRRSDGSTVGLGARQSSANFTLSTFFSWEGHLLKITAPGYFPYQARYVLKDWISITNASAFVATLGDLPLTPVSLSLGKDAWDRQGHVLHGVQSAGTAEQPETAEAIQLTVAASAAMPAQTYARQKPDNTDGSPGPVETVDWEDVINEVWLVDARYLDAQGDYQTYAVATSGSYYPVNNTYLPPGSDPEKIHSWLNRLMEDGQVLAKMTSPTPQTSVAVTGLVNVATLHPGTIAPMLVAKAGSGACKLLPIEDATLTSIKLPRWLAFAADTFASAAAAQGAYGDLRESYASNVPDGKLSALPSLGGGITEEDGYLKYTYQLGVAWEEGAKAPSEGGLGVGPGLLGLQFEASAAVGFDGANQALSFEVGGTIGREEIDLADYAPAFLERLGIEGSINRVAGSASTKRSASLGGALWSDLELSTDVGASIDLTLRYNLEGITGKLPYVGPFITAADRTGALQLFGRLDVGGALQNTTTWRTVEPERSQEVGTDNPIAERPITRQLDDRELTPNRHCFGGQENSAGVYENEFRLGVSFGAGFEGSALGDHLNLHAGIEITGNEDDLVAGQPSLVITPNTFGDWPPIRRAQGDVNAFVRARLDAYITEIEKEWSVNLARIDHQFTTESTITLSDLAVNLVERPVESTVFTGVAPVVVRNLPKGSSFAQRGNLLAFGVFNQNSGQTDLVISLADGDGFGEPVTIATNVEGLGRIALAEVGEDVLLLVWETRPGVLSNPDAYSVLNAACRIAGEWQTAQTVIGLNGYLCDMSVFSSTATNSLVYSQTPTLYDDSSTAIRAVGYDRTTDTWGAGRTVQPLAGRRDLAMACAGWTSPEPGRLITLPGADGLDSLYWDGAHASVPGGAPSVRFSDAEAGHVALCAAGTNETLYAIWIAGTGDARLNRYAPDPLRDPFDPGYDWNGRDAADMWPAVAELAEIDGVVVDVANAWLPEAGPLLSVWSVLGRLNANVFDTQGSGAITNFTLADSPSGRYTDIAVEPLSNGLARVAACYTSRGVRELRVFVVEAATGAHDEDLDNDGIPDRLELALVDAEADDEILDIRDVGGADDFDGDGFDNATEWANGTQADIGSSYPRLGVSVDAIAPLAREDGLLPGRFLISRADGDAAAADLTVYYAIGGTAAETNDYVASARSAVIAAGASAAVVTIQPLADSLVEGTETVALTLLPDAGYALAVNTQAVVSIRDASRDNWRGEHFTPLELADPGISGDDADPDGDGIPNGLEHAMRLDPRTPDPTEIRFAIESGSAYLGYTYDPAVEDMVIDILQSPELRDDVWNPLEGALLLREARQDGLEDVYYESPMTPSNSFYRLRGQRLYP